MPISPRLSRQSLTPDATWSWRVRLQHTPRRSRDRRRDLPRWRQRGTPSWVYGRNDEVYDDASIYRPELWIVDEAKGITVESVAQIKFSFHPFASGPGNCVGQNLAILEMMLVTARTLYRMDVRLAPGSTLGEGTAELGWGRRDRINSR